MKLSTSLLAFVLLLPIVSHASLIVVDNGATITTTWDETFVLTRNMDAGGVAHGIVWDSMFSDLFTGGNPQNEIYDIRASVNGGSDIVLSPWGGWNYRVGFDIVITNGWSRDSLGILWSPNNLGGALLGDSVRLFGSMTHNKDGGFHHLPDFAATTVSFSTYNGNPKLFSNRQNVSSSIPEPVTLALFSLGLAGLGFARRRKES